MVKFETNGKNGSYLLNLPTSLKEITPEYLLDVTHEIKVANNYTLIGICYRERLSSIIFANNTKKNVTTSIVPIFVKCGYTDNAFVNSIKCGEKLVISPSDIALGHHVSASKNLITINNILTYAEGDNKLYTESLNIPDYCYFLEFKLVPNCNINGSYSEDITFKHMNNPYVQPMQGI